MFFSLSLATYYSLSSFAGNLQKFLRFGRAHYILPGGSFGRLHPFKDQKRKTTSRGFPTEDISDLLCLTSGQTLVRDDLYKKFLDLTLKDQQKIFVDFLLKELESCLHRGLDYRILIDDVDRFNRLDNKNDPNTALHFQGDFGILLMPPAPKVQCHSLQSQFHQENTTTSWSDNYGYHIQQSAKEIFQGLTLTYEKYSFVSSSGSVQVENTTETLTDLTGAKSALRTVYMWTDGQSSYYKQTNSMHVYTTGKQVDTITEEVKSCDYSVLGLTSERTENNTVHTVIAGEVTTADQSYAVTETKNDGVNLLTNSKSFTQRTITDDKNTQITYEEAESWTNGLTTSGREYIFNSFQSEDLYKYSAFVRTTNRDGSSKWESSRVTLRREDLYYFVENIYPDENNADVIRNDELHRYLQC